MYKNNQGLEIYERHEIINQIIKARKYKTYLEIGTDKGDTFSKVNIQNKVCCDPVDNVKKEYNFKINYLMTSDEMFDQFDRNKKFDLIFLDGMHEERYLDRDIINALRHLNKGGLILCHDTIPTNVLYARKYQLGNLIQGGWTGNVYKSILKLQQQNIKFYTLINVIHGMTIIEYHDNPYELVVPNYLSTEDYYYIFAQDTYNEEYSINFSLQGYFAMHAIDYNKFKEIILNDIH